jgi:hypothetical protein
MRKNALRQASIRPEAIKETERLDLGHQLKMKVY